MYNNKVDLPTLNGEVKEKNKKVSKKKVKRKVKKGKNYGKI